jgi:hypothetical protein
MIAPSVGEDEQDDGEPIQYVQRVIASFQGLDAETWLRIVILVSLDLQLLFSCDTRAHTLLL